MARSSFAESARTYCVLPFEQIEEGCWNDPALKSRMKGLGTKAEVTDGVERRVRSPRTRLEAMDWNSVQRCPIRAIAFHHAFQAKKISNCGSSTVELGGLNLCRERTRRVPPPVLRNRKTWHIARPIILSVRSRELATRDPYYTSVGSAEPEYAPDDSTT
jgi:hypothetical protein